SGPGLAPAVRAACAARRAGPAADALIRRPHRLDTASKCACSGGSTPPSDRPPAPASTSAPGLPPSLSIVPVLSNSLLMSPCCGRVAIPTPPQRGHSHGVPTVNGAGLDGEPISWYWSPVYMPLAPISQLVKAASAGC